jgi:hypothetical protein
MATAQAFCNICQSKASADTILSHDALWRALDLGEDISVMHVLVDQDDSSDHIWRLSSQERENLRKYLSSGWATALWCALRPVLARIVPIRASRTKPDSLHLNELIMIVLSDIYGLWFPIVWLE